MTTNSHSLMRERERERERFIQSKREQKHQRKLTNRKFNFLVWGFFRPRQKAKAKAKGLAGWLGG